VKLRSPAAPAEWDDYFRLRWEWLREPWGQPPGSERDEYEEKAHHLLAELDGQIVGIGRIHPLADGAWQIRYMAVREEWRGKGIGAAILNGLLDHVRGQGAGRVVLNAREGAAGFYQGRGFEVAGEGPLMFGEIRHVRMEMRVCR
jgi:N-acetylglutamate synthase-like GNAT family acetyltransferase